MNSTIRTLILKPKYLRGGKRDSQSEGGRFLVIAERVYNPWGGYG